MKLYSFSSRKAILSSARLDRTASNDSVISVELGLMTASSSTNTILQMKYCYLNASVSRWLVNRAETMAVGIPVPGWVLAPTK